MQEQPYFTEGSADLKASRRLIADYSLLRLASCLPVCLRSGAMCDLLLSTLIGLSSEWSAPKGRGRTATSKRSFVKRLLVVIVCGYYTDLSSSPLLASSSSAAFAACTRAVWALIHSVAVGGAEVLQCSQSDRRRPTPVLLRFLSRLFHLGHRLVERSVEAVERPFVRS
jgi:hypothetical protein